MAAQSCTPLGVNEEMCLFGIAGDLCRSKLEEKASVVQIVGLCSHPAETACSTLSNIESFSSVTEKRTVRPDAAQGRLRAENPVCNLVQNRPWPSNFGGLRKEAAVECSSCSQPCFYHFRIVGPSPRDFPTARFGPTSVFPTSWELIRSVQHKPVCGP